MPDFKVIYEEFKIRGEDLVDKIKSLIHEGNIRRIIVKDEKGNTYLEVPLTVAAVGVVAVPILAAIGAMAALISNFNLGVERVKTAEEEVPKAPTVPPPPPPPAPPEPGS